MHIYYVFMYMYDVVTNSKIRIRFVNKFDQFEKCTIIKIQKLQNNIMHCKTNLYNEHLRKIIIT